MSALHTRVAGPPLRINLLPLLAQNARNGSLAPSVVQPLEGPAQRELDEAWGAVCAYDFAEKGLLVGLAKYASMSVTRGVGEVGVNVPDVEELAVKRIC